MGFADLVWFPMLKKIQSFAVLELKNSVTGEHASPLVLTKSPETPPSGFAPTLVSAPVAAAKLS
jgi:hypothetical protein